MRGLPTTPTPSACSPMRSNGSLSAARDEAISYAAFRVLEARYIDSIGAVDSISEFDRLMDSLCLPIDVTTTEGDSPAAVGNRIAQRVLTLGFG